MPQQYHAIAQGAATRWSIGRLQIGHLPKTLDKIGVRSLAAAAEIAQNGPRLDRSELIPVTQQYQPRLLWQGVQQLGHRNNFV